MAITFDQAGTLGSVASGTTVSCTDNATAGATVLLWVYFASSTDNGAVTASYGGTAMTQVGSTFAMGSASGFNNFLALFELASAPGASTTVTATTTAALAGAIANTISYAGVGSVGSLSTTSGVVNSGGISNVASASGHLVTCAFTQFNNDATFNSFTGTQRFFGNGSAFQAPFLFGDTAGASTVSFSLNSSADALMGIGAVDLIPQSGVTVTPTTATVAVSGGVPVVTNAPSSVTVTPTTATVAVTGGVPVVENGQNVFVTPTTATVAVTGGVPTVVQNFGPLAKVLNNLSSGNSAIIQTIGDSTCYGSFDTGFSSVDGEQGFTPDTGALYGWAGRMAIALGEFFNANVELALLAVTAGATTGTLWSFPSSAFYDSPVTLFTASGENRPTLTVYHGGWPGAVMADYTSHISNMLAVSNPDLVILNNGFNEVVLSTFQSGLETFVSDVQSACPGAPILATTQNATSITTEGDGLTFAEIHQTLVDTFINTDPALPLSPPLQASNNTAGVWVLDTLQAGQVAATLNTDGLHPIAPGYAEQAQFMLNNLTTGLPGLIADAGLADPTSASVHITGGVPTVTNGQSVVVAPTTATVAVTGGVPTVAATANVESAPASAAPIHVTGGVPTVVLATPSPVSAPTSAVVEITGGSPTITNSSAPFVIHQSVLVTPENRTIRVQHHGA